MYTFVCDAGAGVERDGAERVTGARPPTRPPERAACASSSGANATRPASSAPSTLPPSERKSMDASGEVRMCDAVGDRSGVGGAKARAEATTQVSMSRLFSSAIRCAPFISYYKTPLHQTKLSP
eukprot:scaffold7720_cov129-Isochrysis_galbana.AAC.6